MRAVASIVRPAAHDLLEAGIDQADEHVLEPRRRALRAQHPSAWPRASTPRMGSLTSTSATSRGHRHLLADDDGVLVPDREHHPHSPLERGRHVEASRLAARSPWPTSSTATRWSSTHEHLAGGEVAVERRSADAGARRDLGHADGRAAVGEDARDRVEDPPRPRTQLVAPARGRAEPRAQHCGAFPWPGESGSQRGPHGRTVPMDDGGVDIRAGGPGGRRRLDLPACPRQDSNLRRRP